MVSPWLECYPIFTSLIITDKVTGQLWSLSTTSLQVRIRVQLNSILFAKTLVRKDVASSGTNQAASAAGKDDSDAAKKKADGEQPEGEKKDDEDSFSSKAQIMTLMTTDVDRVSEFAWHLFSLVGELPLIFNPYYFRLIIFE